MARLLTCQRGSAAVEFAFVMPVLAALVLGMMEFGRAMWTRQTMQYAVEQAARAALANAALTGPQIANMVTADLIGMQGTTPSVVASATASQVSVTASYSFAFIVPRLLPFGPIVLTAQCVTPR